MCAVCSSSTNPAHVLACEKIPSYPVTTTWLNLSQIPSHAGENLGLETWTTIQNLRQRGMFLIILLFKLTFFPVEACLWQRNWKQIWSYIIAHLWGKWATASLCSQLENWARIKLLWSQVRWGDLWWRTNWIIINNLQLRLGLFLKHHYKYRLLGSMWGYLGNYSMAGSIMEVRLFSNYFLEITTLL